MEKVPQPQGAEQAKRQTADGVANAIARTLEKRRCAFKTLARIIQSAQMRDEINQTEENELWLLLIDFQGRGLR